MCVSEQVNDYRQYPKTFSGLTPFNGKDLAGWKLRNDKKNKWEVGAATVDDKGKLQCAFVYYSQRLEN